MNRQDIDFVQSSINYQFKNLQLLEQAFTRRSYSEEHPEVQNNEVLEFYGDEILDFFVTKIMQNPARLFFCKNFHRNNILFQQSSCLVGFFKITWVLIVKVCVEV